MESLYWPSTTESHSCGLIQSNRRADSWFSTGAQLWWPLDGDRMELNWHGGDERLSGQRLKRLEAPFTRLWLLKSLQCCLRLAECPSRYVLGGSEAGCITLGWHQLIFLNSSSDANVELSSTCADIRCDMEG